MRLHVLLTDFSPRLEQGAIPYSTIAGMRPQGAIAVISGVQSTLARSLKPAGSLADASLLVKTLATDKLDATSWAPLHVATSMVDSTG
jgi:hypothetical protein